MVDLTGRQKFRWLRLVSTIFNIVQATKMSAFVVGRRGVRSFCQLDISPNHTKLCNIRVKELGRLTDDELAQKGVGWT